jgi:hypothetical protein
MVGPLAEMQQIRSIKSFLRPDLGSNPGFTPLQVSTLINTPPMRFTTGTPSGREGGLNRDRAKNISDVLPGIINIIQEIWDRVDHAWKHNVMLTVSCNKFGTEWTMSGNIMICWQSAVINLGQSGPWVETWTTIHSSNRSVSDSRGTLEPTRCRKASWRINKVYFTKYDSWLFA